MTRRETTRRTARVRTGTLCTFLLAISLAGCGGGPEAAATAWLDALNDGEIERALELSTEQTKALLSSGNSMGEGLAIGDYDVVSVREISDTLAEIVISSRDGESTLELRKINGEWKVGIKK